MMGGCLIPILLSWAPFFPGLPDNGRGIPLPDPPHVGSPSGRQEPPAAVCGRDSTGLWDPTPNGRTPLNALDSQWTRVSPSLCWRAPPRPGRGPVGHQRHGRTTLTDCLASHSVGSRAMAAGVNGGLPCPMQVQARGDRPSTSIPGPRARTSAVSSQHSQSTAQIALANTQHTNLIALHC